MLNDIFWFSNYHFFEHKCELINNILVRARILSPIYKFSFSFFTVISRILPFLYFIQTHLFLTRRGVWRNRRRTGSLDMSVSSADLLNLRQIFVRQQKDSYAGDRIIKLEIICCRLSTEQHIFLTTKKIMNKDSHKYVSVILLYSIISYKK